jgi:hypothetical protein
MFCSESVTDYKDSLCYNSAVCSDCLSMLNKLIKSNDLYQTLEIDLLPLAFLSEKKYAMSLIKQIYKIPFKKMIVDIKNISSFRIFKTTHGLMSNKEDYATYSLNLSGYFSSSDCKYIFDYIGEHKNIHVSINNNLN